MSTTNKEEKVADVSTENIYRLNGRVPLKKAIPFGLQHVLAMFVSNLAPVLIVCSAALVRGTGEHLTSAEITQNKNHKKIYKWMHLPSSRKIQMQKTYKCSRHATTRTRKSGNQHSRTDCNKKFPKQHKIGEY